jgi:hypothetical protein
MEPRNFNLEYFAGLQAALVPLAARDPQAAYELAFTILQAAPREADVARAKGLLDGIVPAAPELAVQVRRASELASMMLANCKQKRSSDQLRRLNWSVYNHCPMICSGCYNPFVTGQLTIGECRPILDALAQAGVEFLLVSGGDPLLWPDLPEFLAYAHGIGLKLGLDSTGVTLTAELLRRIKPYVDTFAFPLDGTSHEMIRAFRHAPRMDLYATALRVLQLCNEEGIQHVRINTTVTRGNFDALEGIAQVLADYPVVKMWVLFQWWGRRASTKDAHRLSVSDAEFASLHDRLVPRLPGINVRLSQAAARQMINFFVRSDGVVVTFGAERNEEFMVGDLRRQTPSEILNSPALSVSSLLVP